MRKPPAENFFFELQLLVFVSEREADGPPDRQSLLLILKKLAPDLVPSAVGELCIFMPAHIFADISFVGCRSPFTVASF